MKNYDRIMRGKLRHAPGVTSNVEFYRYQVNFQLTKD